MSGGRMQKLSAFSHRNIDDGSPVSCFFHDYVQMEKEERSFVRVEVSRRSAPSRHGWRTSLLQEPTKRLVDGQRWQETSDARWSCPVSSDACRPRPLESTRTQSNFTQLSEPNYSPCVAMHAADAQNATQQHVCRRGDEEKQEERMTIQFQNVHSDSGFLKHLHWMPWNWIAEVLSVPFTLECGHAQHCRHTDTTNR